MKTLFCFLLSALCLSARAATYYVAKTGDDGTGDGSSGNPWLTIGKGITEATDGDTVVVSAGRYDERHTIGYTKSGATVKAAFPAVAGAATNSSSRGFYLSAGVSNVVLDGFEITDIGAENRAGVLQRRATACTLSRLYIHNLEPDNYLGTGILTDDMSTNCIIRSNTLYQVEAVGISTLGNGCIVELNDVSRGSNKRVSDGVVVENDCDALRLFGVNNIVRSNYLHDYWMSDSWQTDIEDRPHIDGIMMFSSGVGELCSNNVIYANVIRNVDDQAFITSDFYNATKLIRSVRLYNNVFWNCGGGGLGAAGYYINCYDTDQLVIANNTFIRYGTDGQGSNYISHPVRIQSYYDYGTENFKGGCSNSVVANNIFYGFDGVGDRLIADTNSLVGSVVDYNCWSGTTTTLDAPNDAHTLTSTDPTFVDLLGTWGLAAASPCIGVGTNLNALFTVDKNLVTRGTVWDFGACEYSAPSAPVGSRMTAGTIRVGTARTR